VVVVGPAGYNTNKSIAEISQIESLRERGIYFYNIPPKPGSRESEPSFEFVSTAVSWALGKKIHAIVTAPISKEKWLRAGIPYRGHTEFLTRTAGIKNHAMFFWSEDLKVALFTHHIPLKKVPGTIRQDNILHFIRFVHRELYRLFGRRFSFLVCGLNPHAGEDGFLGAEEKDTIIPVITTLKSEMPIEGPYPPDTIFGKARDRTDCVVIAWYHDQGLIPFKLLNLHSGVNLTLGLPYIRTSPDHGTAYDIAGRDLANPSSMKQAIRLAEDLVTIKSS
jgi:4-hydroxythreonine-4-phosphate dehydrogenase